MASLSTRFHLNNRGEARPCRALVHCPFGDLEKDHFGSTEEAQAAFEVRMAGSIPLLSSYRKAVKKDLTPYGFDKVERDWNDSIENGYIRANWSGLADRIEPYSLSLAQELRRRGEAIEAYGVGDDTDEMNIHRYIGPTFVMAEELIQEAEGLSLTQEEVSILYSTPDAFPAPEGYSARGPQPGEGFGKVIIHEDTGLDGNHIALIPMEDKSDQEVEAIAFSLYRRELADYPEELLRWERQSAEEKKSQVMKQVQGPVEVTNARRYRLPSGLELGTYFPDQLHIWELDGPA